MVNEQYHNENVRSQATYSTMYGTSHKIIEDDSEYKAT